MSMLTEIDEQAGVVRQLLAVNEGSIRQVAELVGPDVDHVLIAARGTSDNAARYAQYVWGARNRLSVALAAPSLFGPYASPPRLDGALVVGISQSGESPDLVEVLSEARSQGRPVVAITNHPASPLGAQADVVVDLCAGEERAVAATKTYTAQLAAVAATSLAMEGAAWDGIADLPSLLDRTISGVGDLDAAVEALVAADRCVVVGRGFHHATAFEWALKLQELTYILAQPYSAADFLHGPVAVVESGFPVLMVASAGPLLAPMAQLAGELRAQGAHVVAIADDAGFPADVVVPIAATEEWLAPIVAAPALQLFAHRLAGARGADPDAPRGLAKVTRTR
jgi:glutamine---fructose-6-phosphate transaminase (isomerizing)